MALRFLHWFRLADESHRARASGCSRAPKWPPFSITVQRWILASERTSLRGAAGGLSHAKIAALDSLSSGLPATARFSLLSTPRPILIRCYVRFISLLRSLFACALPRARFPRNLLESLAFARPSRIDGGPFFAVFSLFNREPGRLDGPDQAGEKRDKGIAARATRITGFSLFAPGSVRSLRVRPTWSKSFALNPTPGPLP